MQRWTAIRERYDPERGDEYVFCELDEDDDGDYVRFDDASAEIARLRKALVWAVKHGATEDEWSVRMLTWFVCEDYFKAEHDGTEASLIETLCRLAEEEE